MTRRKNRFPNFTREVGKASRLGKRKRKGKPALEDSIFFDQVESYRQDPSEQITEYRKEQAKKKKE